MPAHYNSSVPWRHHHRVPALLMGATAAARYLLSTYIIQLISLALNHLTQASLSSPLSPCFSSFHLLPPLPCPAVLLFARKTRAKTSPSPQIPDALYTAVLWVLSVQPLSLPQKPCCTVARRSPWFSISGTVTQPQHHYHLDSITSPSHPPSAPSHASLLPKILSIEFAGHRYSFIFITYSYFLYPCPPLDTPLRGSLLGSSALSRRDHPGQLHQIITPSNSNFPSAISLLLHLPTSKLQ